MEEQQELITSTPVKTCPDFVEPVVDPIEILKKNVSDTLSFLHQERNDFLPEDDIIIPSRKDDHVSKEIDLESINFKKKNESFNVDVEPEDSLQNISNSEAAVEEDLRDIVENEVADVIKVAEEVVNDIKQKEYSGNDNANYLEDSKDDSIVKAQQKSEEAFKFLENEASSPLVNKTPIFEETANFVLREKECYSPESELKSVSFESTSPKSPSKSGIPISKSKQKEPEQVNGGRDVASPTESDLLSKIPVSAKGKVKTIKKHSKDPLKEFVKLSQDVNWDDDESFAIETTQTDPIVKTTVTRITTEETPEDGFQKIVTTETTETVKSKIPVLHQELPGQHDLLTDKNNQSAKSKIPILVTETTRIVSPEITTVERTIISPTSTQVIETSIVSPGSKVSTKSSTIDSDSDDSRQSPQLQEISKKNNVRTVGSSSGSDVALHEAGAELSDDDSGKFLI